MPRRARIAIAGIPWHIIQRGNNRSACFFAEDDYRYFLDTLAVQAVKWQCAVHAYVLMTNHRIPGTVYLTGELLEGDPM